MQFPEELLDALLSVPGDFLEKVAEASHSEVGKFPFGLKEPGVNQLIPQPYLTPLLFGMYKALVDTEFVPADSMVNMEGEQMKKFIPEVEVIDVPNEPDKFVSTLENSGVFFNNNSLTKEDYKKKTQYEIRQKAENLKKNFNSIDEYLKQLRMKISFNKVNNKNIERCVQMLNKTNQFNFTTRRYSMATFKEYISDSKIVSLVVSVEDKLGDYGITGLLTASKNKKTLSIDNFLLSCRILGRKIEDQIINKVIDIASKKKLEFIEGIYIKTLKNSQCENFYINKNFKKINKKKYIFNLKK